MTNKKQQKHLDRKESRKKNKTSTTGKNVKPKNVKNKSANNKNRVVRKSDGKTNKAAIKKKSSPSEQVDKILLEMPQDNPDDCFDYLKQRLAFIANKITTDPDKNIDLFEVFFGLIRKKTTLCSNKRLIMATLLSAVAVMKLVLPGYRVGKHHDDGEEKLSKEVRVLRFFEASLLKHYRELLRRLSYYQCGDGFAQLLQSASQFNFWDELVGYVVSYAINNGNQSCLDTLRELLQNDFHLDISLQIVKSINEIMRKHSYRRHNQFVASVLKLLLLAKTDLSSKSNAISHEHFDDITDEDLLRDLDLTQIRSDPKDLARREGEILTEILVIYLEVVRSFTDEDEGLQMRKLSIANYTLLETVLSGLAMRAEAVNVELLVEIRKEVELLIKLQISNMTKTSIRICTSALTVLFSLSSGLASCIETDYNFMIETVLTVLSQSRIILKKGDNDELLCEDALKLCKHALSSQHFTSQAGRICRLVKQAIYLAIYSGEAKNVEVGGPFLKLVADTLGKYPSIARDVCQEEFDKTLYQLIVKVLILMLPSSPLDFLTLHDKKLLEVKRSAVAESKKNKTKPKRKPRKDGDAKKV